MSYRKSLTVVLILMLFLIMGSMHRTYASHIAKHAHHHTSATHSTGICSWMCAAAQTINGDGPVIVHSFHVLGLVEESPPEFPALLSYSFLPSRAPPQ